MTELWKLPASDIFHNVKLREGSTRFVITAAGISNKTKTRSRTDRHQTGIAAHLDDQRNDVRSKHLEDSGAWSEAGDPIPAGLAAVRQRGLPRIALRRAIDAIHRRLGEKMVLQDIADAACMSRFHFARLFRRSTGYSPMKYLLHARLEQAKALLRQRAMPISDIAVETGFADQSHLTRHFRRTVGMTPLQYVRRCVDELQTAQIQSISVTHGRV